jgi:hypothetical protein
MEHDIVGYLRQVWNKNDLLYERQYGFRPAYSFKSPVVTVCQHKADILDKGVCIEAIIIDFSKSLDLVPHDPLLTKLAATSF